MIWTSSIHNPTFSFVSATSTFIVYVPADGNTMSPDRVAEKLSVTAVPALFFSPDGPPASHAVSTAPDVAVPGTPSVLSAGADSDPEGASWEFAHHSTFRPFWSGPPMSTFVNHCWS
uniref:Unannotated protein n=1 Tax=freshwater metagenome TaxID=449393 RepID=A0A6J7MFA7_9ZZZZ